MNSEQAKRCLEEVARARKISRGMVDGYLEISIGAGNPEYFYQIAFRERVYNPEQHGIYDPSQRYEANGKTLEEAVTRLMEKLDGTVLRKGITALLVLEPRGSNGDIPKPDGDSKLVREFPVVYESSNGD